MLLEGFLVVFKEAVWVVKGVDSCDQVIAFPRYDLRGRKLPSAVREMLLRDQISLTDCAPFPVPVVDVDRAEVFDPRELLRNDPIARALADELPCEAGLTGSRALGGQRGDIDLVFYDEPCFKEVIDALADMRDRGVTQPPTTGKWDGLGSSAKALRSKLSLLEGSWRGHPYSIRLVKGPRSPRRPVFLKRGYARGEVLRSGFTTPTTIVLSSGVVVESLRLQHTELPPGVRVEVRGTWELRTDGAVLTLPPGSILEVVAT